MIVVDTSVWIDWIKAKDTDGTRKLERILDQDEVVVGDIVLFEILQGARDEVHARKLERLLAGCVQVEMMSRSMAIAAAANFRFLRGKGVTIRKAPDIIIGTWCIENACALLHNDRDFLPMVEHLGLKEF
jgi:predicted nucleic acid-binding protein